MNRSNSNNRLIDPQWLNVLKYYIGLSSKQKQNYADHLLPQQKQYLLSLFELYSKNNGILNTVYPADTDKHLLHKQGYRFKHALQKLQNVSAAAMILAVVVLTGATAWLQRESLSNVFSNTQTQAFYEDWAAESLVNIDMKGKLEDPDRDGLLNGWEFEMGSDPANADTNNNGFLDGVDVLELSYDHELPSEVSYQEASQALFDAQMSAHNFGNAHEKSPVLAEFLQKTYVLSSHESLETSLVPQGSGVLYSDNTQHVIWMSSHVELDRLNPGVEIVLKSEYGEKKYEVSSKNIVSLADARQAYSSYDSVTLMAPVSFKAGVKYMKVVAELKQV